MNIVGSIVLWTSYVISLYFTIFWLIVFLNASPDFKKEEKEKRKLTKFPRVSVLVPAYNEEKSIVATLKSLINLNYPKEKLQIIVINDGSTDRTREKVEEIISKNKDIDMILLNQENQGKAASLNNALKIAKGKFFACLDADSVVDRRSLKKMLYVYQRERNKDLAIVTPALKVGKPKTLIQKLQRLEYLVALFVARLMSHLDCIYVAPGPFSLYRRNIIKKLGGFSEDNLTEDMEIAYRVQSHNYQLKQCFDAYVYTTAPANPKQLYKQRNRWFKGGFLNVLLYKKMLMNKAYGDFGLVQMSINLFTFFLSVSALSFFFYYLIWPILLNLKDLWVVRFDFLPYMKDIFNFNFHILNINITITFVLLSLLLITITVFVLSHKNARERVRKHGTLTIIPYFFIYYILLSLVAVVVIGELLLGKKQKW